MERICDIARMRSFSRRIRAQGGRLGFVPTMGFLHQGHLSLVRAARRSSDVVVVSIFVNPAQFDRRDDLERYPRDLERDARLLEAEKVDLLFTPAPSEMYPPGFVTYVTVEELTLPLCGANRPGHFRGVTTVVAKLFNIVEPSLAFFGEKDFQQLVVVKRMVRDLAFDLEIVAVPTVREADGVALSSRNARLKPEERVAARCLSRALEAVLRAVEEGEKSSARLVAAARGEIEREPLARAEYISVFDPETLGEVQIVDRPVRVAVAVWIGETRLIDNRLIQPPVAKARHSALGTEVSAERS